MRPRDIELQAPWIRTQLIDWLVKLSDRGWQEENWVAYPSSSSRFDDALDFFDDSGVLDEPRGRLGYVLVDEAEVAAMAALNSALDSVLTGDSSGDEERIPSQEWGKVAKAANEALRTLRRSSGE
ncbi:SCO4402 family protein [Streptomyces sp. G7(2002)]|uniref:SCO4402 family protein n=1 Tax=Streptomyces sp. G7(2002) TaxID=2971798 RepID=UPI00406C3B02